MATEILNPRQLRNFVDRCLDGTTMGVRNAAQVHIEYWDETYQVYRIAPAYSMSMQQTEHGPRTVVISARKL